MADRLPDSIGHDPDKFLWIIGSYHFVIGNLAREDHLILCAFAGGDDDPGWLLLGLHRVKDNGLLQTLIIPKSFLSRVETVQAVERHLSQKKLSEGSKIRAIAKTSRSDGDEFAIVREELHRRGEKACVKI